MSRLGRRSSWGGQQIAAGDLGSHRLDEWSDRHQVGIGAHELVGDRPAELARHGLVSADLVDVGGERRAVEQLTVEMSGDQPEGGEDSSGDDQHPHDDGHPSVSVRHALREALGQRETLSPPMRASERQRVSGQPLRRPYAAWPGNAINGRRA